MPSASGKSPLGHNYPPQLGSTNSLVRTCSKLLELDGGDMLEVFLEVIDRTPGDKQELLVVNSLRMISISNPVLSMS